MNNATQPISSESEQAPKRPQPTFVNAGIDALLMQFGQKLDPCMPGFLASIRAAIIAELGEVVYEVVPSYASLLVYYEPRAVRTYDLEQALDTIAENTPWLCSPWSADAEAPGKLVEVPVYYYEESDSAAENDMAKICEISGLTRDEVIAIHSGRDYQVYALGFAPGFAYLGALDERIQLPRLANPRKGIAAGSVGIAEGQTAVYPQESPGGWNILGFSPFVWFNPEGSAEAASTAKKTLPLTPVQVGDRIRFKPMSKTEYEKARLQYEAEQGGSA
ncbi:allophanate hydrolase subunit 1 [Idiomarina sp. A28L]|uniref:5-oxoprolinase subunit B family protein n=1 Tax=Idiomarina sp. A28L TaxID=1036674 RepID=UPI0002138B2E|nr:allophanate hydrolase subunit 1 [Idiomarina sp. A28L]EGN75073.1 allophanate hydrolase subunit 1 [Idiomarina sp. A28L]